MDLKHMRYVSLSWKISQNRCVFFYFTKKRTYISEIIYLAKSKLNIK